MSGYNVITHQLKRLSAPWPGIEPDQVTLLAVVRNEAIRLPFFLSYYRRLGVHRFLFIDNNSSDGTPELLLRETNTTVFGTSESFARGEWGAAWLQILLDRYCTDRWVMFADADELLIWPGYEGQTLTDLIREMTAKAAEALFTVMIDMYSDRPFGAIGYRAGDNPIDHFPFLDRRPYDLYSAENFPFRQIRGGVRQRLFQSVPNHRVPPPTISKMPLVRWRRGQQFAMGTHLYATPMRLAPMRGGLLHFKMLDDFPEKCRLEVERREHYDNAREYRVMAAALGRLPDGSCYKPDVSLRFRDSVDLVERGILSVRTPFPQ